MRLELIKTNLLGAYSRGSGGADERLEGIKNVLGAFSIEDEEDMRLERLRMGAVEAIGQRLRKKIRMIRKGFYGGWCGQMIEADYK